MCYEMNENRIWSNTFVNCLASFSILSKHSNDIFAKLNKNIKYSLTIEGAPAAFFTSLNISNVSPKRNNSRSFGSEQIRHPFTFVWQPLSKYLHAAINLWSLMPEEQKELLVLRRNNRVKMICENVSDEFADKEQTHMICSTHNTFIELFWVHVNMRKCGAKLKCVCKIDCMMCVCSVSVIVNKFAICLRNLGIVCPERLV